MGARPLACRRPSSSRRGSRSPSCGPIVADMAAARPAAGVEIVTGDTKVVDRGAADGLYITTAGVGSSRRPPARRRARAAGRQGPRLGHHRRPRHGGHAGPRRPRPRGRPPFRHRAARRSGRGAPRRRPATRWLRDPTRGGLGTVCNELARDADLAVVLDEASLPVAPAVNGACDLLGIDPLYVANEGKFVAVVARRRGRRRPRRPAGPPPRSDGGPHRRDPRRPSGDRRAAHRLRRDPHRRHARRRPPSPHLLIAASGAGCG